MDQNHIDYIIDAHRNHPREPKKAFRKWDRETPYDTHPIWCATTIATETQLDKTTREEGVVALLYHDVPEDTTKGITHLSPRLQELVNHMTFAGGSSQEMQEIWSKPTEIRLYKLYDKVSNLLDGSWMDEKKRTQYQIYTQTLCEDVVRHYGQLNITLMAKTLGMKK